MASLRRIPGRKVWIACYTDADRNRKQRSTKTRNRDKAMRIAEAYEFAARKEHTFSDIMATIADIMEITEEVPAYTLREYTKQFLERKKPTISESTFANAERAIKVFVEGMREKADKPMLTLTPADLHRWRDEQVARISSNTVRKYQTVVAEMFRKAHAEEVIPRNIATKDLWQPLKKVDAVRTAFTKDQLQELLKVAEGEWKGLILFGLYTGQRLGDVAGLNWANLDMEKGLLSFRARKTGKQMVLPIAEPLSKYITEELSTPDSPDGPLFPVSSNRAVGSLSNQFDVLLRDAGLRTGERMKTGTKQARRTRNPLTFHSLRHTATTFMSAAGINEDAIMQVVGHESAAVSRGYNHEEIERKKKALSCLPDLSAG